MNTPRAAAALALAVAALSAFPGVPAQAAGPDETVVVTGQGPGLAAAVHAAGGRVVTALPLIHGAVARLPHGAHLGPRWTVAADRDLAVAGSDVGGGPASTVRATLGLGAPDDEGDGITVAVVDTGVADVPDLAGRVRHVDVTGDGVGDGYGHGTFVAGLIAGDGSSSRGRAAGVAPGADVLDVRVAHDDGSTSLVEVLKGLQVVARHPEVDVLNLSLSSDSPLPYQLDPLTIGLDALWDRGVLVVVPAGNDGGQGRGSIASPGSDPTLLTVGGLDTAGTADRRDDTVAAWSSQGPAPQGAAKPDLVAPGAHVVSTGAPGSVVWKSNPGSQLAGGYFTGSGTSFATAVVSGSVAALLADRPDLAPDRVKSLLTQTAYDVRGAHRATGAGGTDLAKAMTKAARSGHGDRRLHPARWDDDCWGVGTWDLAHWDVAGGIDAWMANAWGANAWGANSWAARQWAASSWAANAWAARQWSARQWSARQWSTVSWD
jgi:serine protease AprX